MQKSLKIFLMMIAALTIGFFLTSCDGGENPGGGDLPNETPTITTFDFKQASYEILLDERVTVELDLEEAVKKENIVYTSANPEVATFVLGVLKGVSVGETTISISYKDDVNDLTKTVTVKVTLTEEEQAFYDEAKVFDAKVEALSNFTSSDVDALKALVDELNEISMDVAKYIINGDLVIDMYNKARALVIDEMIEALPDVVEVSHEAAIKAARAAYKEAETNVRKHVSKLDDLKAKEEALEKAIFDATPDGITLKYHEESYMKINGNLLLVAETAKKDPNTVIVWDSSDKNVATVVDGVVTGLKPGTSQISATIEGTDLTMSLGITVLPENISEAMQFVLDSHNTTPFTKRNLRIGGSDPSGYSYDVMGSVSDFFYKDLYINDKYLEKGNASGEYYLRSSYNANIEFITVHYTGMMGTNHEADLVAEVITKTENEPGGTEVSIHYVTGNQGTYHCLDDGPYGAWHAGDARSRYYSNSPSTITIGGTTYDVFEWMPTGVAYDGCDLLEVEWSASNDFYYEINGKKTKIKLPETWDFTKNGVNRHTAHIYNSDGTVTSKMEYAYYFENVPVEKLFNSQGFAVKVIDGEYYMGPTWWCYDQVYQGRICGMGGNINSIGIESCVAKNTNLWQTWQETAKLVAKLMLDNNLGIEMVRSHHFYTGKDCPQPMLANKLQIWYEFIELVKTEYEKLTKFNDYTFSFSTDSSYLSKNGTVKKWASDAQSVEYTVTISNGSTTETVTLYSWLPAK